MWVPKYRKRVLTGKIKQRIEGMLKFGCQINEWEVLELAVCPDHVHLYLQAWPKDSPSHIMNVLKGGSARKIRVLYPQLEEIYWGASFWADGFMVKSVGDFTAKVVAEYIVKQRINQVV